MRYYLISLIALLGFVSCTRAPEEVAVQSVSLNLPAAEMIVGETVQLTASITPTNATDKNILWGSSKQSVATVSDNGLVTAISEGASTITATVGGKSASCQVTVSKRIIAVLSISLNTPNLTLIEGETATLSATVLPEDATENNVSWTSSANEIATVDNGKVTAVKAGSAIITAKAGEKSAQCVVEVKSKVIAVTEVTLNKNKLTLVEGDSETLAATVKPDNATNKAVTWSSSDASVASVSSNGKVSALKEGTAAITATAGDKQAICVVEVSKKVISVTSITLNKNTLSLEKGKSETLQATVNPSNATDKTVTWTTSNVAVASVDQNGKVYAVGGGNAIITAKAEDKTATCDVTVTVPVESISLDKTTLSMFRGQEVTITATVNPADATDKTVTWSSSNTSVATISNGKVKAIGAGNAIITAKAGNKSATCSVSVTVPVTGVSVTPSTVTIIQGETRQLSAMVTPTDATNPAVTWSTSNSSIASIAANGLLTANTPGTATITVKTQDGGYTATCSVTVNEKPKATSISLSKSSFEASIGQAYPISVTVSPADAYCEYEWSSSDTRVASISGTGKQVSIQTLDYGTTTIIVKEKRSGLTASITVGTIVTNFAWNMVTTKIYKGYPLVTIRLNETVQLGYNCSPSSATHLFDDLSQFIFYESNVVVSSPSSVSISDDGLVKGLKVGIVGIQAGGRIQAATESSDRIYIRVIDNGNTEPIDDDDNEHGWD